MRKLLAIVFFLNIYSQAFGQGIITTSGPDEPSGGSYLSSSSFKGILTDPITSSDGPLDLTTFFDALTMEIDGGLNGFYHIPPDPHGAAGTDRVIAVVNTSIECRDKSGTQLWVSDLNGFFSQWAGDTPLGTMTFDPKVIWDDFEDRFVVVTLEKNDVLNSPADPSDESHILVAVSKTASPATATSADWWYLDINSKITIVNECWADYPGFAVDEEAVYITNNMFAFRTDGGGNEGVRLWIIDKGVVGGFYSGAAASVTVHNPIGGWAAVTQQPAMILQAPGRPLPGGVIGTYLVGYSGLTNGTDEFVQVIRIDNPLGATSFTAAQINVGDIEDESWPALTDAPQLGGAMPIEVNDRRALDAVWRDDPNHSPLLWFTTTINPDVTYDASNSGETTAHYFMLKTSPWPPTLEHQATIGGDDISGGGTAVYTFMPSLTVDPDGNAYFGFSASSSLMYCGAYAAGTRWNDVVGPTDPLHATETIKAGIGSYVMTFGASRNRWGDYSATALDPANNDFWIFNQYAMAEGSPVGGETGRWGTVWGTGDAPLPVELGSYTAEVLQNGVTLNWTTESEIENIGFIIERKIEDGEWEDIISYKNDNSLRGQGTTSSYTEYTYLDNLVEFGETYDYRLVDVDYNGTLNYNAVRTVTIDIVQIRHQIDGPLTSINTLIAYPNPFNPNITLTYSISDNNNVIVEIFNINGEKVNVLINEEQKIGWNSVSWNGTNSTGEVLPAGIYFGKVSVGNEVKTTKLMLLK